MRIFSRFTTIAAAAGIFLLAGCAPRTTLAINIEPDGKNCVIIFDNVDEGDFAMSGTVTVADGEIVTLEKNIEKGSVRFELVPSEYAVRIDADLSDMPATENTETAVFTEEISGNGAETITALSPGDYYVRITAVGKTNGSAILQVRKK